MGANTHQQSSWGIHLWDRTEEVFGHTSLEIATLTSCYSKFYKELGEIERDYAKGVRKLCNKFGPKQDVGGQESHKDRGFRLFLTELGYKAGQHEILAELYTKSVTEDLKLKVKDANKEIEKLRKELKRSQEVTEHVQKSHEKYNIKYQKSFQDCLIAERSLQKAENDCSLSRKDVEKLRHYAVEKQKQSDESKKVLDRHLTKLQEVTNNHLHRALPSVLDNLQSLSIHTANHLCQVMKRGVTAEKESEKVIASCNIEMGDIIDKIQPDVDSEKVIEMYKSGAVPSVDMLDHALVDTSHLKQSTNTIRKSKSFTKIPTAEKDNQSAYQSKRKLEAKIEILEEEIAKGQKEMSALQKMVNSYTENPQYGDANKLRLELDKVTHNVQLLESDRYSLTNQLRDVSSKLHVPSNPVLTRASDTCDMSDTQSQSSGYPSSASSGDVDSQFGETCSTRDSQCEDTCSTRDSQFGDSDSYRDTIQSLLTKSPGYYRPIDNNPCSLMVAEDLHEDLPPPPAEMLEDDINHGEDVTNGPVDIVRALYNFDVIAEGNISMREGEAFYKLGEDDGGWIRVKRTDGGEEGFVPTAFLNFSNN